MSVCDSCPLSQPLVVRYSCVAFVSMSPINLLVVSARPCYVGMQPVVTSLEMVRVKRVSMRLVRSTSEKHKTTRDPKMIIDESQDVFEGLGCVDEE